MEENDAIKTQNQLDESVLFTEHQKFKQWWLWLILIVINGGLIVAMVVQYLKNDQPITKVDLLITFSIILFITLLFWVFKLETRIKKEGIYVRFFPFHLKFRYYAWEDLTKCYVRKYAPLMEYGGWGLRYGLSNSGLAYNVSGNKGLQLHLKRKNRKILIGTQKGEEINKVLSALGQEKA